MKKCYDTPTHHTELNECAREGFRDGFAVGVFTGLVAALACILLLRLFSALTTLPAETEETTHETAEIAVLTSETETNDKLSEPVNYETKAAENGIDAETREVVERVVAAEARGEGYLGMVAVAQTIKDRGDLWGKTYLEVATAPGQFAEPYEGEISDLVKTAVHDVFDLGFRATETPTLYFYAHQKCFPSWALEKYPVAVIGGHTFMY